MATTPDLQTRLNEITVQCKLEPYFLRAEPGLTVALTVRPEVRAAPLDSDKIECVRREVTKIPGARMRGDGK